MTSSRPRIRLRSPADVLSAVPFLLGFHPTASFVVLGLKRKDMMLHARCDLPAVDAPVRVLQQYGRELADVLRNCGAESAVLVGYGSAEQVDPAMRAVSKACATRRIKMTDRLRAHDGRYWSYVCRNPECCSPDGTPFDLGASPVAAEAVFAGLEVAPDRETVIHSLDPPTGPALDAIERASSRARHRLAEFFASGGDTAKAYEAGVIAIDEALARYANGKPLTDDELAWLALLLALIPVRDVAWGRIDADGQSGALFHRRLLTDLVCRGDPALVAPPAMLLGYLFWRLGDGVRAGVAVDRSLAADPCYSAGVLMHEVLDRAIPPWAIDRTRSGDLIEHLDESTEAPEHLDESTEAPVRGNPAPEPIRERQRTPKPRSPRPNRR